MATDTKPFSRGESFLEQAIWKYFSIERFLFLLRHKALYFAAANQFEDSFEGATHLASASGNMKVDNVFGFKEYAEMASFSIGANKAFKDLRRMTKVNCWHISNFENDAMWALYAHQGKGVAIVSSPANVLSATADYRIQPTYGTETIHFGPVQYVDLSENRHHFDMLERFFYKHLYFQWENEFRFVVSLRMAEEFGVKIPEQGILVGIEPRQMITAIMFGPYLSDREKTDTLSQLEEHKLQHLVVYSSRLLHPFFI